jgi:hypothetical protein
MVAPLHTQVARIGNQVPGRMLVNSHKPVILRDLDARAQCVIHRIGQLALLLTGTSGLQRQGDEWQSSSIQGFLR